MPGDERLLRRALRNLLENARRYGGGEITLHAQRDAGPPPRAELRVCDRGPGVPEALRERIFEPFFRLPGHAEREGGVGLGLALVKQIAERHGGQRALRGAGRRRQLLRAQPAGGLGRPFTRQTAAALATSCRNAPAAASAHRAARRR